MTFDQTNKPRANLSVVGLGLLAVGFVALLRAMLFDTAPEVTHNIGLMQVQMLWFHLGSVVSIIGAIFLVGGRIATAATERL